MLFLVLTTQDDAAAATVPSTQRLTTYRRAYDYLANQAGVISAYAFVGERRGMMVLDVAGPAEAHALLLGVPGASFLRFEVFTLLSLTDSVEQIDAALRAINTPLLR